MHIANICHIISLETNKNTKNRFITPGFFLAGMLFFGGAAPLLPILSHFLIIKQVHQSINLRVLRIPRWDGKDRDEDEIIDVWLPIQPLTIVLKCYCIEVSYQRLEHKIIERRVSPFK